MAMATYRQGAHKYTLKATSAGNSYTLQVSSIPNAGTTKFNGAAPAYSSADTVTLDDALKTELSAALKEFKQRFVSSHTQAATKV